jgi:hypothetical protein
MNDITKTLHALWGATREPGPLADPEGDMIGTGITNAARTEDGRLRLAVGFYQHGDETRLRDYEVMSEVGDEYGGAVEIQLTLRPTLADWQPNGLVSRTLAAMQEAVDVVRRVTDIIEEDPQ